jgi:hypothetical protein
MSPELVRGTLILHQAWGNVNVARLCVGASLTLHRRFHL